MSIPTAPFGRTGHDSSRVIFGAAALGGMRQERADQLLDTLLPAGVNHIDTAAIYGDSELVVKQIRGEYRVKDAGLKPLHAEARAALAGLDGWSFDHVRRENNAHADDLVNQALDAAA